jgi:hypothetical protein
VIAVRQLARWQGLEALQVDVLQSEWVRMRRWISSTASLPVTFSMIMPSSVKFVFA